MGRTRVAVSLLLMMLLLACAGCGGGADADTSTPGRPQALPDLPPPSALHGASYTQDGLAHWGSEYGDALPHNRATRAGTDVALAPDWPHPGGTADGLAYATYQFDLTGFDLPPVLHFTWSQPGSLSAGWIGLADFPRDRWDWFQSPTGGSLSFDPARHISGSGTLYVVVLTTGTAPWQLRRVYIALSQDAGEWPMQGCNPQHTGRAQVVGPLAPVLKWSLPAGAGSAVVVGANGVAFVSGNNELVAVSPAGAVLWTFPIGAFITTSPAVADDGTVYVGAWDKQLHAVNPDGTERWHFETNGFIEASPTIGPDGTVYFGSNDGKLYALNSDGTEKWFYQYGTAADSTYASPALGADGTVYGAWHGSYTSGAVLALNSDGTLKWQHNTAGAIYGSPALDSNENLYISCIDNHLYSYTPAGVIRWAYDTGAQIRSTPAIGGDDTVYFGCGNLYALNSDGTLKWQCAIPGGTNYNAPAIGVDGTIYVCSVDGHLVAVQPNGTMAWSTTGGTSSPVLGVDGTLFCTGNEGLFAFGPGGINPGPPIVQITAGPETGYAPLVVYFDASASFDPDGGALALYGWDWNGDGVVDATSTTDATATHEYADIGVYNATLYVTDDEGETSSASVEIVAGDPKRPPNARLRADGYHGYATFKANLSASYSYDPDGGSITKFEWDWDSDGTYDFDSNTTAIASHDYHDVGNYEVTVRVTDDEGETDTASVYLTVNTGAAEDWRMFGRTATHDRRSAFYGPQALAIGRAYSTGDAVYTSPALAADGTVYAGSLDHSLYALYANGGLAWSYATGGIILSSPAVATDGTVYCGSEDKKLYALNADGTLKWQYPTGGEIVASPTLAADGTVYIGSFDGKLYALNPDGTQKWAFTTGDSIWSSAALDAAGVAYVGSYDHKLYAINPNGSQKWSYTTGGVIRSSPALGADGTVYFGCDDNKLYALKADGTLRWSYTTGDVVRSSPALAVDGTVYVGSGDMYFYALSSAGTLLWRYYMHGSAESSPAIGADGLVYVGSADGNVYCFTPAGLVQCQIDLGAMVVSSPALGADGKLYVGAWDGMVHALVAGRS